MYPICGINFVISYILYCHVLLLLRVSNVYNKLLSKSILNISRYKWINQDWTIEQRMVYAEEHWAYCLGFGLPATTITFFLSTLRAGGVFALIYPSVS